MREVEEYFQDCYILLVCVFISNKIYNDLYIYFKSISINLIADSKKRQLCIWKKDPVTSMLIFFHVDIFFNSYTFKFYF